MLQERLLAILDRKNHWAWTHFAEGRVPLPQLLPHFQQEWEVYVRDFPVLLARVLGQGPPQEVCSMLAANIYEEQTGGVSKTAAHPELFLRMMEGCGFSPLQFAQVKLLPAARAYREHLDQASWGKPWVVGAAVLTTFVEGSVNERRELAALDSPPDEDHEAALRRHPLVRFHKVDPKALDLVRVHRLVEGGHRRDAWEGVLKNTPPELEDAVASALEKALQLWLAYRDEVDAACGIRR
jgi:pyrroloquinoline-quinone synthase